MGIPPLVKLMVEGTEGQKEKSLELVAALMYSGRIGLTTESLIANAVMDAGGLEAMANMLEHCAMEQQQHAAAALEFFCIDLKTRARVVTALGGHKAMVALAERGSAIHKEFLARLFWKLIHEDGDPLAEEHCKAFLKSPAGQFKARPAQASMEAPIDMEERCRK